MKVTFMVLKDVVKGVNLDTAEELFKAKSLKELPRINDHFTYDKRKFKVLRVHHDFRYEHFCGGVVTNGITVYAMELY